VVVAVKSLNPAVASLNWKSASDALSREQLVPVLFTVRQAVLQVEREVGEDLAAVGAAEALRMEVGAQRLQTVLSVHFWSQFDKRSFDTPHYSNCRAGQAGPHPLPHPRLA